MASCAPAASNNISRTTTTTLPEPSKQPEPTTETPKPSEGERSRLLQMQNLLARMSELRGLETKAPVSLRVITRAAMIEKIRQRLRTEIPPAVVRAEGQFLQALGLVPKDFDYEAGILSLLESQIAGFYEPDEQTMYVMDDLGSMDAEATLAHELVHALQDEHFKLGPRLKFRPDASDSQSAVQGLAEGDATSAMLDFVLKPMEQNALNLSDAKIDFHVSAASALAPDLSTFPSFIRRSLVAPYVDGTRFVHDRRRKQGWPAVNSAWERAPQTTEQLLHPSKYDISEPAEAVEVPSTAALGNGWSVSHTDILGEQALRVVLEEWSPKRAARDAAEGWGGDRMMVATRDRASNQSAAAWHILFDKAPPGAPTNARAKKLFGLVVSSWNEHPKKGTTASCRLLDGARPVAIATRGRGVALVGGDALIDSGAKDSNEAACDQALRWATALVASD